MKNPLAPPARPFLTAAWRDLAVLTFEADPAVLASHAPAGTRVDLFRGRALVSVVGFGFENARVLGWAFPWHRNFSEVNLRFYVVRDTPAGPRRGVVFIKEISPRRAVAWMARLCFNENFETWPMRQVVVRPGVDNHWRGQVAYEWQRRGRWERLAMTTIGPPATLTEGSEAEFVASHFYGYSRQRDGRCLEFRVERAPWKAWAVAGYDYDADATALYGAELGECLRRLPTSAFVCDGSNIALYRGERAA